MRILLINPPFHRLKGFGHVYYPLGLGYLSSVAIKLGIESMIYNAEAPDINEKLNNSEEYNQKIKSHKKYIAALNDSGHYVWKEVEDVIRRYRPDIIGISVMTAKYGSALKISEIAKNITSGNATVVWGGAHPTICAKEVIREPLVDFAVLGEGEETFEELLRQLHSGHDDFGKIKGLAYKDKGITKINQARELCDDLDKFLPPNRERIFYPERYFADSFGNMITLRGCPFHCGYCSANNIWSRKVRYRRIENVVSEIRHIKEKYASKEFYFWDDSFTLNRSRVISLCNELINASLGINWGCTTRVDLLDDELLFLMKKAGCDYISIGIESGSDRILKIIEKGITTQQIKKAVQMLRASKISFEAFFMVGFPDETKQDLQKTFQLMKALGNSPVCFSIFTPYPGSVQFESAKNYGLIPEKINWSDYSHQSSENYFVKDISRVQFKEYVDHISLWVDSKNAKDLKISRLFVKALSEFSNLVKRPALVFHKLKTLLKILRRKLFS